MERRNNTDTWQQEQDTNIIPELQPSSITHKFYSIPCAVTVPSKPTYGNLTILTVPVLCNYSLLDPLPSSLFCSAAQAFAHYHLCALLIQYREQRDRPHFFLLREATSFRSWLEYGGSGLVRSQCPVDGLAELNRNGQWRWSWKRG